MPTINLPNDWGSRPHQKPLWRFLAAGGRRAVAVWHRRAGKDSTALNWAAAASHQRVGIYWHMLPEQAQARKVVWDGIDAKGRRMIDQAFPPVLRSATNKQEMKIELKCGSIWQCVGSDNYNSLIGSNPVGVVFSEYSVADPAAWDFIRPILTENGGWALFIYTARGRNHGAMLFDMAKKNDSWFCERLTVEDTKVISLEAIEEERKAGMSEDMINQEFYCSFEAALVGAYYGHLMQAADKDGRITRVPHDPTIPVQTWWDLGMDDSTAIWFAQVAGREIHLIDYYENSGVGFEHYAKILKEKGYTYGEPLRPVTGHLLPHDGAVRELGTGHSRLETLKSLGIHARVVPKQNPEDGIQAVRNLLPRCWFDAIKCERGIEAMRQYRQEWSDKLRSFKGNPLHDWTSHAADAFRTGGVGLSDQPRAFSGRKAPTDWKVA